MLTFSVNKTIDMDTKARQLADLINSINKYNAEYVADAYFSLIDSDAFLDLDNYAYTCKKHYLDKQNKSKVSSIISSEDAANGYRGVIAEELTDDFDYIADCERLVDMEEKVEDFKKLRWYVIINVGVDLYRMLFLTCEEDIEATRKFKYYVNKLALEEYFRDLLSDIRILGVLKRELK